MASFERVQQGRGRAVPLKLVRDVRTRWSSTYEMGTRALRLREDLEAWLPNARGDTQDCSLTAEDWEVLEDVVGLLYPFYRTTQSLSITKDPMIQSGWAAYNHLFDALDRQAAAARGVGAWEGPRIAAVEAARGKLAQYYSRTREPFADIYAAGCVLDPSARKGAYDGSTWAPHERVRYLGVATQMYQREYGTFEPISQSGAATESSHAVMVRYAFYYHP